MRILNLSLLGLTGLILVVILQKFLVPSEGDLLKPRFIDYHKPTSQVATISYESLGEGIVPFSYTEEKAELTNHFQFLGLNDRPDRESPLVVCSFHS